MRLRFTPVGIAVLCIAMIACCTIANAEIVPSVVGNDQVITARLGIGDPNRGLVGIQGSWNDEQPDHLWGAGVFGQYDISDGMRQGISAILPVPSSWWETLDKLQARSYVGVEVGAVNIAEDPQAETAAYLGARLGPLVGECGLRVTEGGGVSQGGGAVIDESGLIWRLGLEWRF